MSDIAIVIRTADQTRKAEVTLASETTGADVIQAAVDNWALPTDTEYSLVNVSKGTSLLSNQPLSLGTVSSGDILELQPLLIAG